MPPAHLRVRVTPKSSCDEVGGWRGDRLSVRVRAAPDKGRANAAVGKVVADALGVPKSAVTVVRGGASRLKTIAVAGMTLDEVRERLPVR